MIYELKNCRTGEKGAYTSTVDITEKDGELSFFFHSENTEYFCPHDFYNGIHSDGDACEVLIGTDPERRVYYEIEISAEGLLMLAKMTNRGIDKDGEIILDIGFVDEPFVKTEYVKTENGYDARITFKIDDIRTGEGEVYFNAFRLETDGGEHDKHLFALNPTLVPKFHMTDKFLWLKDYV